MPKEAVTEDVQETTSPKDESATETPTASSSTPEPTEPADDGDDADDLPPHVRETIRKANGEAARYRKALRDAEAKLEAIEAKDRDAKLSTEERLEAAEKRAKEAEEKANARILAAERRASLAATVSHPERVLRLMDDPDAYFDGTDPHREKILADFPEYSLKPASSSSATPGASGPAPRAPATDEASAALARGDVTTYAALIAAAQAKARGPKE